MEALVSAFERLRSVAEGLGANPYVLYGATILGIVLLFIARAIGKRFADDIYEGLKRALLTLFGMRGKESKPAEAEPVAGGGADAITESEGDGLIRTRRHSYRVSEVIAQGNLSMVHGGTDESGNPVVLKIAGAAADNDLLATEGRILRLLHTDAERYGKHLPEILDEFHTHDGRQGNVLGRLDGYDLVTVRQKYKQGIPERHIIWLFRRVLSVLGYAHSRGIVHGNVEPAHLMIRPSDHNVWLIDWCYAIFEPARTGQGFRVLNEVYSAPEVAERKPPLPSADLYSAGLCMIYALGGDPVTQRIPEHVDERIRRFLEFFVIASPLGRAQDAWEMYNKLDELREDIYGPHQFVPFEM